MRNNPPKIFISYSHNDRPHAKKLASELKSAGAEVYVDYKGTKPGDSFPRRIEKALEWCDTLILLWTKEAQESHWVEKEWHYALNKQKRIIPCLVDGTELSPLLSTTQYFDFREIGAGMSQLFGALELSPEGLTPFPGFLKPREEHIYLNPEIHKHTCDRIPHNDHFIKSEKPDRKVQFFCIHGCEEQSPFGLSKRFHYQITRQLNALGVISNTQNLHSICDSIEFTDSTKEPLYKSNLIQKVFVFFGLDPDEFAPPMDSNLGDIVKNSPLLKGKSSKDIVTLYLRVIREEWRDFTPEVLQWFIDKFCSETVLPRTSPRFYFFISLIYEEEHDEEDCEKMLTAMEGVSNMITLPELTPVHKKPIIEWMREYKAANTSSERKALFTKYFQESTSYDMEIVETQLDELIRKEIHK